MIDKRKIIWIIISFFIAVASILTVIKQSKIFRPEILFSHIRHMDKGWLLLAFVCMFGFIWFEGLAIARIAGALGMQVRSGQGLVYGAADIYFSAITPSATGGQPASAYFMIKDGMHGSMITTILLLNLIMYSIALLTVGGVAFLFFGNILLRFSIESKLLFGFGFCVLIGLTILFYFLLKKGQIIYGIGDRIFRFLEKIKLVKHGDLKRKKLASSMEQYKECAKVISGNKRMLIEAYLLNVLQRVSQIAVSFCVFMACGKGWGLSLHAMIVQCFVAVGSSSVPIPGAMGVADYLMLNGFMSLLGRAEAVHMELLCRGITFYGAVGTGSIITIIGYLMRRRRENK